MTGGRLRSPLAIAGLVAHLALETHGSGGFRVTLSHAHACTAGSAAAAAWYIGPASTTPTSGCAGPSPGVKGAPSSGGR